MTTIQELAHAMYHAFEEKERTNGDKFWSLKDDSPQWMTDVIHTAHGDMLPDDQRYAMIRDAVSKLDDYNGDTDEARDSIEASIFTHDLTSWLASRNDRYAYCDEAIDEYGRPENTITLLQWGQYAELTEVYDLVVAALTELTEEETDEE